MYSVCIDLLMFRVVPLLMSPECHVHNVEPNLSCLNISGTLNLINVTDCLAIHGILQYICCLLMPI